MSSEYQALIERVMGKCEECGDCLLWTGAMTNKSVPVLSIGGKTQPIRRALWRGMGKALIPGRSIVTNCGHEGCVEPSHFEQVKRGRRPGFKMRPDQRANIAAARRRASVLTWDDVRQLRALECPKAAVELGEQKGIGFSMVQKIRQGAHWKEVLTSPFAGLVR